MVSRHATRTTRRRISIWLPGEPSNGAGLYLGAGGHECVLFRKFGDPGRGAAQKEEAELGVDEEAP